MQKSILLFLSALLITSSLSAQQPPWRRANGSAGIFIADIDVYHHNPDTLYAIGDQFLMSIDRGEHWNPANGPFTDIGALKIDPSNSNIIYASHYSFAWGANDISITRNGGQTWELLFTGRFFPAPVVEIDPADLQTVYVGVGPSRILRSYDRGQNWDTLSIPPIASGLTSLAIAPSNNNVLYAGYLNGIFKSTDKGQTWSLLSLGFPIQSWVSLAIHPQNSQIIYAGIFSSGVNPGGVYKSNDGGITWHEMNSGLSQNDWDIYSLSLNPKNPDELFIGTGGNINVFRTTNGGYYWSAFSNGLPASGHVPTIAIDTSNSRIYIGRPSGIYVYDSLITSLASNAPELLTKFSLSPIYPNPFNSSTTIAYTLPKKGFVSLIIYDALGRKVKELFEGFLTPGRYEIKFHADKYPSGEYFFRFQAGEKVYVRKALLVR